MTTKEKQLLEKVFNPYGEELGPCDCHTCPYEKECELNNPDFDANSCIA